MTQRHEISVLQREVAELKREIHHLSHLMASHVTPRTPTPTCIAIAFEGAQPAMPQTLAAKQKITATATEFDSAGTQITPNAASLNWSVSDTNLASIETNPDGTATITANEQGSVTVTVKDEQNNLTATDVLTITEALPEQPPTAATPPAEPGSPTTIAIEFGTPA